MEKNRKFVHRNAKIMALLGKYDIQDNKQKALIRDDRNVSRLCKENLFKFTRHIRPESKLNICYITMRKRKLSAHSQRKRRREMAKYLKD